MKYSYEDALAHFHIPFAHPGGKRLTNEIIANENLTIDTTILDAGCGTGSTSFLLSQISEATIEAIDKHPQMVQAALDQAKKSSRPFNVSLGSVEKLPYPDHHFTIIISESVTAFTNVEKTLNEFARVLKENGRLYLIEMTKEATLTTEMEEEMKTFYQLEKVLSEQDWCEALVTAGLTEVNILKASTIAEMIAEGRRIGEDSSHQHIKLLQEDFAQILMDHYQLNNLLSENLGYRVICAMKEI